MPSMSGSGAVRVLLAEVVRAGGEHGDRLAGPVHAARFQEVEDRVVALGEPLADFGPALVLRRVHAVAAEALAQPHHALGAASENSGSKRTYSWRVTPTTLPGHMSSTRSRSRL